LSKKQKKLVLQPSLKEKLLFYDYNVAIVIPEGADLRAPFMTEDHYFPVKSKTLKATKNLTNLSPKSSRTGVLYELKTKKRRSQVASQGVIDELGLMLPAI
jgi:hypothetical protein